MIDDLDQQQLSEEATLQEKGHSIISGGSTDRLKSKVSLKTKFKFLLIGFIVGSVASLVLCAAIFDIGRNYNPDGNVSTPSIDLVVLQERIEQCNELATATYLYTNAENYIGEPVIFGLFDIPYVTGKDFVLKYDGIIKAGVSLDDVEISQREDGSILVTLPQPHIISHELDEESFETLREHETIFSSIKINDIQQFRAGAKEAMEVRAFEKGVMDEASANAQESIRSIIEIVVPEEIPIEFQQAEQK